MISIKEMEMAWMQWHFLPKYSETTMSLLRAEYIIAPLMASLYGLSFSAMRLRLV